jgi:hypothetical protein
MGLLIQIPPLLAWAAIVAGVVSIWGGFRHYRKIVEIPRFTGVTRSFWITVAALIFQGVVMVAIGIWRLIALG